MGTETIDTCPNCHISLVRTSIRTRLDGFLSSVPATGTYERCTKCDYARVTFNPPVQVAVEMVKP